jgi:hypothetical protein
MTRFKTLSVTALLFGAGILAGCSSSEHRDRVSRSSRGDEVRPAGDVERASGAARKVPRDAEVVDEGRGDTLRYTARGDGTVYLVDASADTVIWSGPIRDSDRITVDPGKNRIEINGREQANIDLKSGDRFRLYFLRGSSRYDSRY